MQRALELARRAGEAGEVPVGAVVVREGAIVGEGHNQPITAHDASAHAEIVALRAAGARLGNYRLPSCDLYVTLEPCVMCAGAIVHARIRRVVFATRDPKTGAAGSAFDLLTSDRHNHRVDVAEGLQGEEAAALLHGFFRARRDGRASTRI